MAVNMCFFFTVDLVDGDTHALWVRPVRALELELVEHGETVGRGHRTVAKIWRVVLLELHLRHAHPALSVGGRQLDVEGAVALGEGGGRLTEERAEDGDLLVGVARGVEVGHVGLVEGDVVLVVDVPLVGQGAGAVGAVGDGAGGLEGDPLVGVDVILAGAVLEAELLVRASEASKIARDCLYLPIVWYLRHVHNWGRRSSVVLDDNL